jgi:hypothetical protein
MRVCVAGSRIPLEWRNLSDGSLPLADVRAATSDPSYLLRW